MQVRLRSDSNNRWAIGSSLALYDAGHLGVVESLRTFVQVGVGRASPDAGTSKVLLPAPLGRRYDVQAVFPNGRRVVLRDVAPGGGVTLRELPWWQRPRLGLLRTWTAALRHLDWRWALLHLALVSGLFLVWRRFSRRLPRRLHGDRRLGHFILEEVIGEGAMGEVHRAVDQRSGVRLAIKLLHRHRSTRRSDRLRLIREAEVLKQLDHPNIVRIVDAGEVGGRLYLAMELLLGETLGERIQRAGPLPPRQVLELLGETTHALVYIHRRGILHRDLKGSNLFLTQTQVKLTDFGLARQAAMTPLTESRAAIGTLAYMAPEVLLGAEATPRSDLYSLGVAGFEALTGALPFPDLSELLRPDRPAPEIKDDGTVVSPRLISIVRRLLAADPEERFVDAEALSTAIATAHARAEQACDGRISYLHGAIGDNSTVAPDIRPSPTRAAPWKTYFDEAKRRYAAGHLVEGRARILECIGSLEDLLKQTTSGRFPAPTDQEVEAVLALHHRLNEPHSGEPR